jgi:flagellar motor switch/type III secretory pathway protein FliN
MPTGEPTLAVKLECAIASTSSELCLLLPWSAIEPVASQILDRGEPTDGADPDQARALEQGLARTRTLVRAEIGTARVPVEEVLALAPGSLVKLDAKAENGVRLLAHRVELALGMPGRSGARKAVKLVSPIQPRSDPAALPLPHSLSGPSPEPAGERDAVRERIHQLRAVDLRVWAELGDTEMALASALSLPQGSILELDQDAQEPVVLFVNGVRFARGTLVVTDDGQWAIQVSALS